MAEVCNFFCNIQTGQARHFDIQKSNLRLTGIDQYQDFIAIGRFTANFQIRPGFGKHGFEVRSQFLFIICNNGFICHVTVPRL